MKIKKFFQYLFKRLFQLIFFKVYGRVKILDSKFTSKVKVHKLRNIRINNKEYIVNKKIYEIECGRIYTDTVENVAIIKDNYILPHISYQQIKGVLKTEKYNKVLKTGTNRIKKKINGSVLSLVQGASGNNYFHFLFDIVPKIYCIEQSKLLKRIDFFYLSDCHNWQISILSKFGIDKKKIISSRKYRHIEAKKIFAVEHPWYQKGKVQEEIKNIPRWIIFFLRRKFLKFSKDKKFSKKIFIDRSDSNFKHCKLVNNEEIINFLIKKNFQSYQVSKLSFFEQINLFKKAKIIIGPHGAAFTNIIFSSPGMKLVELIPRDHKSVKCKKFSKLLGFNYKKIELKKLYFKNDIIIGDIRISTKDLEKYL